MKSIKKIIGSASCIAGYFIFSAAAFAAAEAGHEEITFLGDWLPRLVNFAVIAFVVVYFLRKPARDFFANRSAEIGKAMQESKEARERAEAALVEMDRKVKELEADRMIADAQDRGEKDRQALVEEGKKVAADVQVQVKQGIDVELQKAKSALAVEASLLSLELAEGGIRKKIGHDDHERIVKEYIDKVGGKG